MEFLERRTKKWVWIVSGIHVSVLLYECTGFSSLCSFFHVSRIHVSVFQRMLTIYKQEWKILAWIPELSVRQGQGTAGLYTGQPLAVLSAVRRKHWEPTPAPAVSSPPLPRLNCVVSRTVLICLLQSVTLPSLYGCGLDSTLKAQHHHI